MAEGPDLAKSLHFGMMLKVFGYIVRVHLIFGYYLLFKIAIGQILIAVNAKCQTK